MTITPTKSQQAQQYAEKMAEGLFKNPWVDPQKEVTTKFKQVYSDGYTACEQSMWRSVEEELPRNDDKVFVIIHGAYVCGWYDHKYELWEIFGIGSYSRKEASYWMPIPPIPDTNTEKK